LQPSAATAAGQQQPLAQAAAPLPGGLAASAAASPPAQAPAQAPATAGSVATGAAAAANANGTAATTLPTAEASTNASGAAASRMASSTLGAGQAEHSWLNGLLRWMGAGHERMVAHSALNMSATSSADTELANTAVVAREQTAVDAGARGERGMQQPGSAPAGQEATVARAGQAGISHVASSPSAATAALGADGDAGAQLPSSVAATADSLKSALMTLISSKDVPVALRETAQQLVQHITGQQLLLVPERNASPYTHMTMFIPFQGQDGGQTASVHIQTRKGARGELDSGNCRLLFDLRMQSLGETLVDVQVVDKIVSVTLWNNHPAIGEITEDAKGQVSEALRQAGYQLLTLRTTPLADRGAGGSDELAPPNVTAPDAWSSKPYKGVDFRV